MAWARTTTCPGPGVGLGTSSSFITSAGPNSRTTIAFIKAPSLGGNCTDDRRCKSSDGCRCDLLHLSGARCLRLWVRVACREEPLEIAVEDQRLFLRRDVEFLKDRLLLL